MESRLRDDVSEQVKFSQIYIYCIIVTGENVLLSMDRLHRFPLGKLIHLHRGVNTLKLYRWKINKIKYTLTGFF